MGNSILSTITSCNSNVSVSGENYLGGLIGYCDTSIITDCYSSSTISGDTTSAIGARHQQTGGLIGYASRSTISNSYNTGDVTGCSYVGGLIGRNYNSVVKNCYNSGDIFGTLDGIGGLVGDNSQSTITNCYNVGNISGNDDKIGGIVGWSSRTKVIKNCYNTGKISGDSTYTGNRIGGIVGAITVYTHVTNCYFNSETSGQTEGIGYYSVRSDEIAESKTTAELKQQTTFIDWDFESDTAAWKIEEGLTYPTLTMYMPAPVSTRELTLMEKNGYSLTVAPTPTRDSGKMFVVSETSGKAVFTIYTTSGDKIATMLKDIETDGTHKFNFDVISKLKAGLYFIVMKVNGDRKAVSKIVKIKK